MVMKRSDFSHPVWFEKLRWYHTHNFLLPNLRLVYKREDKDLLSINKLCLLIYSKK